MELIIACLLAIVAARVYQYNPHLTKWVWFEIAVNTIAAIWMAVIYIGKVT